MSSKPNFIKFISSTDASTNILNKITCNSNHKTGNKLSNIILNRLIEVNANRSTKISNVTDLLACDIKDMHITTFTCDGVVIDRLCNCETRVILSKWIFDAFHKAYPMEDLRIPAMLKYISTIEDSTIRYNSIVYIRFYRYLGWVMSTWNSLLN